MQILCLELTCRVTLGRLFNHVVSRFFLCQVGMVMVTTSEHCGRIKHQSLGKLYMSVFLCVSNTTSCTSHSPSWIVKWESVYIPLGRARSSGSHCPAMIWEMALSHERDDCFSILRAPQDQWPDMYNLEWALTSPWNTDQMSLGVGRG